MVTCFLLMFVLLYIVFYSSMERLLSDWEIDNFKTEAVYAETVLNASVNYIPASTRERATWDELYDAVLDGVWAVRDFANEYMTIADHELSMVNIMTVLDIDSNVMFERFYDYREGVYDLDKPDLSAAYAKLGPLTQAKGSIPSGEMNSLDMSQTGLSGFVEQDGSIFYLSCFPIIHNDGSGPSVGTHITGRILSDAEIANLVEDSHLDFNVESVGSAGLTAEQLNQFLADGSLVVPDAHNATVYEKLTDIYGEPSLAVYLSSPRTLFDNGNAFISRMLLVTAACCIVVLVLVIVLQNRMLVRPLAALVREVDRVNLETAAASIVVCHGNREVADLADSMNNMLERIRDDRDVIQKNADQLYQAANYDHLTGLRNRQSIRAYVEEALLREEVIQGGLTLFFVDLDRFKYINDSMGHSTGDTLIVKVAARLQATLENVELARVGGDEFMIVVPGLQDRVECQMYVDKIFDVFGEPFPILERELNITVSIGSATFPLDGQNAEVLISNAEMAMYEAKEQGKGLYAFYQEEFHLALQRKINIENKIRKAVSEGCKEFYPYFQPKLNIVTGQIDSCEALMRWVAADGIMSPAEFIPPAEETGLIIPMTWCMMHDSCRWGKIFEEEGIPQTVAVNISAQVLLHEDFLYHVSACTQETGVDIGQLDIEITESTLLNDMDRVNYVLGELNRMGAEISVDDFGTGYSSLSYLNRLSVDRLKIDKEFIQGINNDEESREIVRAILAMARSLNMCVTAEGVEDVVQYTFLRKEKCEEAQGYLISRPLPPEEYIEFCKKWRDGEIRPM